MIFTGWYIYDPKDGALRSSVFLDWWRPVYGPFRLLEGFETEEEACNCIQYTPFRNCRAIAAEDMPLLVDELLARHVLGDG